MNNDQLYERYQRQLILKGFGAEAQQKLLSAFVLVIGAGGLGCPVLQYLVAAGVGSIGIIDDDVVDLSNLHRQVLYNVQMIGRPKADCAVEVLQQLNPQTRFNIYNERLTNKNAAAILSAFDVIIDGSDNFATCYLVNDACVLLNKPLIYGAISQYEGQVAVFNVLQNNERSANYRDLFPHPPTPYLRSVLRNLPLDKVASRLAPRQIHLLFKTVRYSWISHFVDLCPHGFKSSPCAFITCSFVYT